MIQKSFLPALLAFVFCFAANGADTLYDVWGGNSLLSVSQFTSVDRHGYTLLGHGNGTGTFQGRYNYYVIAAKTNVYVDAVKGSDGTYFREGWSYSVNMAEGTWHNSSGPPDRKYMHMLGLKPSSGTYGSVAAYSNPGNWQSVTFYVYSPPLPAESAPPLLVTTSHWDLQWVTSAKVVLRGTATDASAGERGIAFVKVNGKRASNDTAAGAGIASWSYALTLKPGTNNVVVVAADGSGNTMTNTVRLVLDHTKPVVAITSPPTGARVTDNAVTFRGTASDNIGLSNLFIRFNDDAWEPLTPTTSWQVRKTLRPGANVLVVYAEDNAGNSSATATNKVTLAVGAEIAVGVIGVGGVKPNYDGQTLIVGDIYNISATNARDSGWKFLNWTDESGRVLTNKPALRFTMRPQLGLTATFVDTNKPSVTISSPVNKSVWNAADVLVSGKAADNDAVQAVMVQVNNGAWTYADGSTSWEAAAHLSLGTNTLRAKSIDVSGNTSAVATATCVYTTPELQEIQGYITRMKQLAEAHNVRGFMAMYDPEYMHGGDDKEISEEDVADILPVLRTFKFQLESVLIEEDRAQILGTLTVTTAGAAQPMISTGDELPGFFWVRKTAQGWRAFGDQARADVSVETGHNTTPGDDHYFLRLAVRGEQPMTAASVTGPDDEPFWLERDSRYGGFTGFLNLEELPAPEIGTEYHFTVFFEDGTHQVLRDPVKSWIVGGPNVSITAARGSVTVRWVDLRSVVPDLLHYWVVIDGPGFSMERDDLPPTTTSVTFRNSAFVPDRAFTATVYVFNELDDFAYQMKVFSIP